MPDKLLFQDNNRKRNCDETTQVWPEYSSHTSAVGHQPARRHDQANQGPVGFNRHFPGEYPQTRT
jgi:hypothetical protein